MSLRPQGSAAAFDSWLAGQLRDMYNSVIDEPLPDDLVGLIKEHREADAAARSEAPDAPRKKEVE